MVVAAKTEPFQTELTWADTRDYVHVLDVSTIKMMKELSDPINVKTWLLPGKLRQSSSVRGQSINSIIFSTFSNVISI